MFEHRQYQSDAVDYVLNDKDRPILCSPTGSGKSFICASVAKSIIDQGGTFGILTPREEILTQMASTMGQVCGYENVGILKSGQQWNRMRSVQVISWPTLVARTKRSEAWFPDVDMLAIDECHLALSPRMAERILPYYEERSRVFGVTATPARKSGKGLGSYFSHIKHVTTVRQLIAEGKLAPLEYWAGKLADISKIGESHGDFNNKDLGAASMPLIGDVIDNWGRLASERQTLVFAVNIAHCEALTERYQMAGVKAEALHNGLTPEQRQKIVEAFKVGRIQVLVNVTIASYGFDAPSVDCIVLARPTKSIVLHLQMLGRGMRICEGKTSCMVLDHADNVRRLGQADDLFRWRLDGRRKASANWTRDKRSEDAKKGEDSVQECGECQYLFSRSRNCPKCGWQIPFAKKDVDSVDADLVRIAEQKEDAREIGWPDNQTFYRMLLHHADSRQYKRTWAFWKYKAKTGEKPGYGWDQLETIEPSVRVRNWITAQLRAYARSKKKERTAA